MTTKEPMVEVSALFKRMSFEEVVAWCKGHKEELERTLMGQAVLRCIREGNMKRLKRYWRGG